MESIGAVRIRGAAAGFARSLLLLVLPLVLRPKNYSDTYSIEIFEASRRHNA